MNKITRLVLHREKDKEGKKAYQQFKIYCLCVQCVYACSPVCMQTKVCVCEGQRLAPSTMWILVINAHLQDGWQESYPLSHPDGPY